MGPYQNIPAIVINDTDDDTDRNATLTSKKHKKKNIRYSGMMFLAIVGVSLMLSMKGGGKGNKDGGHGGSSLTNLRTIAITDTITVIDTYRPCDYPTSHQGSPGKCRQVCYNTKEEQAQASDDSFAHRGIYPTTCTGTVIKCDHLHPDITACFFDTTTVTCPPCDYPTSFQGYMSDVHECLQRCHNTKEEQTQASNDDPRVTSTTCTGTFIKIGRKGTCFFDTTTDSF